MKLTLEWLNDHLDTDAGLEEIAERLTGIGLEVEEVVDRAGELAAFVTARVVEAKPHPNADKLQLCIVDNGTEQVQVVCDSGVTSRLLHSPLHAPQPLDRLLLGDVARFQLIGQLAHGCGHSGLHAARVAVTILAMVAPVV